MNKVNVEKMELIGALKSNLEKHIKDINEARALRREEVIHSLQQVIEKTKADTSYQPIETLTFPQPDSHEADYQKAIKMAEMSVDAVIELSEHQFDQLVMDNWVWKHDFLLKTQSYLGK